MMARNDYLAALNNSPTRQIEVERKKHFHYSGNIESLIVRTSMELISASTVLKELGHATRLGIYKKLVKAGLLDVNYLGRYASTTLAAFELFLS